MVHVGKGKGTLLQNEIIITVSLYMYHFMYHFTEAGY
jgi:hypothetical protein